MSTPKLPAKILIVMALPQESRQRLEAAGADLLHTGVGKVNAASTLARRLAEIRRARQALPMVINLGTAGKYVTDGADADSATHCGAALDAASRAFETLCRESLLPLVDQ